MQPKELPSPTDPFAVRITLFRRRISFLGCPTEGKEWKPKRKEISQEIQRCLNSEEQSLGGKSRLCMKRPLCLLKNRPKVRVTFEVFQRIWDIWLAPPFFFPVPFHFSKKRKTSLPTLDQAAINRFLSVPLPARIWVQFPGRNRFLDTRWRLSSQQACLQGTGGGNSQEFSFKNHHNHPTPCASSSFMVWRTRLTPELACGMIPRAFSLFLLLYIVINLECFND
ncbi:hypothetical protein E2320_012271 [Naja naja]|nr:hypothetical protein E2320_012271 [Naja naja]